MNPPCVRDLLNPTDHDMIDTHNDNEDPEKHIDETLSHMEEEQYLPFTTLFSSGMPSSSPDIRSTLPPQQGPATIAVAVTPTPAASALTSPSTPLSIIVINLSDTSSSGF